ncbi:MAG: DinB family protein [Dehalococcoidia bacterium]
MMRTRIDERWQELLALLDGLDAVGIERPLGDGWTVKVHVAHITAWERSLLGILKKGSRADAMGVPGDLWQGHDTDAINAFLAARARGERAEAIREQLLETHAELTGVLRGLTDEDVALPYSAYQPHDPPSNANPVSGWIAGNTWEHYEEHIGWLRAGLEP